MTARNHHAKMTALVIVARISQTDVISELMIDSDTSGTRQILDNSMRYASAELVLPNQFTCLFGGPIKIVLKDIQCYWFPE